MYKGYWYDTSGKERADLWPLKLDHNRLDLAIEEALHVLPDTDLIVKNSRLDWGLISIEESKRMLICRD